MPLAVQAPRWPPRPPLGLRSPSPAHCRSGRGPGPWAVSGGAASCHGQAGKGLAVWGPAIRCWEVRRYLCVGVCVRVCACPHACAAESLSRAGPCHCGCMCVTRVGAPGCCWVLSRAGGPVSWVCCCLIPVLHVPVLHVGVNSASCVSGVVSSFSFLLLPAFIRTQSSLKPAQVPLGPLTRAELCVGCCGFCQSPAPPPPPPGVVPAVRDG